MAARIATLQRLPVATIVLALIPIAMVLAYRALLAADPEPTRNDQVQYLALARGFLDRGEFTRAVPGEPFVPEPLRYPGYPLFVAFLCGTVGCEHVVEAQAVLLAITVFMVVRLARSFVGTRAALAAGGIVAVFPAFSYFAALRLSETLATFLLVASSAAVVALLERPSRARAVACGVLLGALALTRPFFLPLPLFLVVIPLAPRYRSRSLAAAAVVALAAYAVVIGPMVAYSISNFGRPFTGNLGAQLWQGYFQGRTRADLDDFEREQVDLAVVAIQRQEGLADRREQAYAYVALDEELRRRAIDLIRHDPLGWVARGALRSAELWGGDPPARDSGTTLPPTARALWYALNLSLLGVGIIGAIRLLRRPSVAAAIPLAIVVFVWLLSFPLWAEGRYSLPAKPFLAIGAVAALGPRRPAAPS